MTLGVVLATTGSLTLGSRMTLGTWDFFFFLSLGHLGLIWPSWLQLLHTGTKDLGARAESLDSRLAVQGQHALLNPSGSKLSTT